MLLPGKVDVRMAFAVWMRNFTVYRRTWMTNILPNFFEPILYLLGMGIGLGFYLSEGIQGEPYLAFLAPGLMASAAANGATYEVTYNVFVKMNFARLYDAFLGTPAEPQDIAFGELMWAVTRALIYGLAFELVLAVFTLCGYPLLSATPWLLLTPVAMVLVGLLFALIGMLFTVHVKVIDLYAYYFTLWITPLFLFSGIFFPVSRFPYGETIAWFTPLYHSVRLLRALARGAVDTATAVSFVWIAVVTAALFGMVLRRMRERMLR